MRNLQGTLHLKLGRRLVDKGKFRAGNTKISHKVKLANVYDVLSSGGQQSMSRTLLALADLSCGCSRERHLKVANGWTEMASTED